MVYNYANLNLILVYRGEYCQMKKCLALCILAIFAVSLTACSGTNTVPSSIDAATQAVATTAAPTEAPTEATEYKIHLPYSCFPAGGLPTDSDLILTNEDRECGIISKEKVSTGGMIITVEKDKYDQLLEHQKNKLCELIEREQADMYIDRIEYNDDFRKLLSIKFLKKLSLSTVLTMTKTVLYCTLYHIQIIRITKKSIMRVYIIKHY